MLILLILGLLIVAAAAAVGAVGFLDNRGTDHQLASGFDAFGRTMHGSSGQLFSTIRCSVCRRPMTRRPRPRRATT